MEQTDTFWSFKNKKRNLTVQQRNEVVMVGKEKGPSTIFSNTGFSQGKFYFSFRIRKLINQNEFIVGCCTDKQRLDKWVGYDENGWGYISLGNKYHRGNSGVGVPYGKNFGTGSIVDVLLDLVSHQIRFFVNNEDQGVAFNLPKGETFYIAISMWYPGEFIEYLYHKSLPTTSVSIQASAHIPIQDESKEAISLDQNPLLQRQSLSVNDSVLPLGTISIIDWKPKLSCKEEVQQLTSLPQLKKLDIVLKECQAWVDSFLWQSDVNIYQLDVNEIFSIALYTHDLLWKGEQDENFYFQLNVMLRKRSPADFAKWKGYLYFIQSALSKFPDLNTTVYRGIPFAALDMIQKEYKEKRPIYWSGFTSTTPDLAVAKSFSKDNGIIMCIKVYSGKYIKKYSIIQGEDEILLSPNLKFVVTKSVEKRDGFYFLEMEEQAKAFVF